MGTAPGSGAQAGFARRAEINRPGLTSRAQAAGPAPPCATTSLDVGGWTPCPARAGTTQDDGCAGDIANNLGALWRVRPGSRSAAWRTGRGGRTVSALALPGLRPGRRGDRPAPTGLQRAQRSGTVAAKRLLPPRATARGRRARNPAVLSRQRTGPGLAAAGLATDPQRPRVTEIQPASGGPNGRISPAATAPEIRTQPRPPSGLGGAAPAPCGDQSPAKLEPCWHPLCRRAAPATLAACSRRPWKYGRTPRPSQSQGGRVWGAPCRGPERWLCAWKSTPDQIASWTAPKLRAMGQAPVVSPALPTVRPNCRPRPSRARRRAGLPEASRRDRATGGGQPNRRKTREHRPQRSPGAGLRPDGPAWWTSLADGLLTTPASCRPRASAPLEGPGPVDPADGRSLQPRARCRP